MIHLEPSLHSPGRFRLRIAELALLIYTAGAITGAAPARAAMPSSGTITPSNTSVAWTGASLAGASLDESTCNEGVTCDTYTLRLAPGDYTGKRITVGITWLNPADDFDLYIHQNTADGPIVTQSAGGAPSTTERASISIGPPIVAVTRVYVVRVVAFSVATPIGYAGDGSLVAVPAPRQAIYLPGSLRFSQNVTLRAPVAARDCEPSVRVDVNGNAYASAIRGVPAGVDLWRFNLNQNSSGFDPGMQNPVYLGQPDAFLPSDSTGGADGGGDVDLAVSFPFPSSPDSIPVLTLVSLAAADISSAYSFDRGEHFTLSPAVVPVPADDRQWIEADGPNRVYLLYRAPIPATGLFVSRSDDHGATYPTTGLVNPSGTTPGYIDVDHTTGTVYAAHAGSSALTMGRSTDQGVTWRNTTVDNTTSHRALFDVVKVGDDGTVYGLWSDQTNIYLAHSTDGGVTWSEKVRVNDNSVYRTNLFPWLEAGSAGRVDVVWFGTTTATNLDASDWVVLMAQTLDATAPSPTFRQQVIGDHVIHGSNISLGGLTGSLNRNLCDYFQIALDPQGAAVVAYTDDHNDFDGHTYVTRQLDGSSLYASANGNGMVNPANPPPPPPPDPSDPQVSDFLHDAVTGLVEPIVTDSPFDILWIKYSCDNPGTPMITATMKLSSLAAIPSGVNWRMNFTANAPGGVSDRGDQFWLKANTDNAAIPAYTYGTAVRNGDGTLTYTTKGTANFGAFDQTNSTVTVKVDFRKLNPFVTHGPPIGDGSVLQGLRGQTFTTGANGARDLTRGGSEFVFHVCGTLSVSDPGSSARVAEFRRPPNPNPTLRSSTVEFAVGKPGFVELSVYDVRGARVRTIQAGQMSPGLYTRTWDGRTDRFSDALPGMYFFVLNTSDGVVSRRIGLIH